MLNIETLKSYAREGENVLLQGRHGVGKTAIIKEVFNSTFGEQNVKWRYFSAPTMDPWVDFVGVPKNYTREDGTEVFKIIPPEHFTGDEQIEALFFDELNRADDKTLNALMELIQFRSINGRKFPHLKCIWAAINPASDDDNNYMVHELDPAQMDRFDKQISIPYELDMTYFTTKFGKDIANVANAWWNGHERKRVISPRKLEGILSSFMKGHDISDCTLLANVEELKQNLDSVGRIEVLKTAARSGDPARIRDTFTLDKIREYENIIVSADRSQEIFTLIYPHISKEIQDFIKDTYKFNYVSDVERKLTPGQSKILKDNAGSKIAFTLGNGVKIKSKMKDISKNFTVDDILSKLIGMTDANEVFPFIYDEDAEQKEMYDLASSFDKNDFSDFYTLAVAMLYQHVKMNGKYGIEENNIWKFVTKIPEDASVNANLQISVVENHRLKKAIMNGDLDYVLRLIVETPEQLFYN